VHRTKKRDLVGWFNVRMDLGNTLVLLLTAATRGEMWRFGSTNEGGGGGRGAGAGGGEGGGGRGRRGEGFPAVGAAEAAAKAAAEAAAKASSAKTYALQRGARIAYRLGGEFWPGTVTAKTKHADWYSVTFNTPMQYTHEIMQSAAGSFY
jgi:hypothetical protein